MRRAARILSKVNGGKRGGRVTGVVVLGRNNVSVVRCYNSGASFTSYSLPRSRVMKKLSPRAVVDPEEEDPLYLLDIYDQRDPINMWHWTSQKEGRLPVNWYTDPRRVGTLTGVAQPEHWISFGSTVWRFFVFWGGLMVILLCIENYFPWKAAHTYRLSRPVEFGITHPNLYLEFGGDPDIDFKNFEELWNKPGGHKFVTVTDIVYNQQCMSPDPLVKDWKPLQPEILELKHEGDYTRDYMKEYYEHVKKMDANRERFHHEWSGPYLQWNYVRSPLYNGGGKRYIMNDDC